MAGQRNRLTLERVEGATQRRPQIVLRRHEISEQCNALGYRDHHPGERHLG